MVPPASAIQGEPHVLPHVLLKLVVLTHRSMSRPDQKLLDNLDSAQKKLELALSSDDAEEEVTYPI